MIDLGSSSDMVGEEFTKPLALRLEAMFAWLGAYWLRHRAEFELQREHRRHWARIQQECSRIRDIA
jgi:hypothetical protein